MLKIRDFLNKNRIYVLMLIFIGLFNMALYLVPAIDEHRQQKEQMLEFQQLQVEEEIEEREKAIAININQNEHLQRLAAALTFLFTFIILTGLAIFITFVKLRVRKQQPLPKILSPPVPGWEAQDAVRIAVIFVFFNYILFLTEAVLGDFFGIKIADSSVRMVFNTILMDFLALSFILYFVFIKFGQRLAAVGLALKDFFQGSFLGVLGYLGFLPVLLVAVFISYLLGKYFNIEPQSQPIFDLLMKEERMPILVILTVFVGVIGPVIEEIFFRGFLYSALKKRFTIGMSMFLTSFVFAALHMNTLGFLPIFSLAFVLVYMFDKTGSLVPSIVIHCAHNCMIIIFLFLSRFFSGNF
jgi:membrane protease YdiL (CAAX protease family)